MTAMRRVLSAMVATGLAIRGLASGPIGGVYKYNGTFLWVRCGTLSVQTIREIGHAKQISVDLNFPKGAVLKKDKAGNQWFTLIFADQGADWKWHQSKGGGVLNAPGGTIKPGIHTVVIPLAGIPASVLKEKQQTINLGAGASGFDKYTDFSVLRIRPR